MVRRFGVGARRERRLRLEGLEQRSLLSAGGLGQPVSEGVSQVSLQLPYNRSDWYEPQMSDDGRYVAFSAPARLVPEDTNDVDDVYFVDLQTSELTWVSKPQDGSQPDDGSWKPEISPDGRYVAFMSRANNLLAEDQDPSIDLFVYDRVTAIRECITSAQDGDALAARFSGNNEKIVYEFEFDDNSPSAPNAPTKDIVLYDRTTGERRVVTKSYDGGAANNISWRPHISHDGGYVVFQSMSSNLVPNDLNLAWDVFVYDVAADTLECLSVNPDGDPANGESQSVRISGDGRFVTFQSSATDLTAASADGIENVYLLDRATGEQTAVAGDGFPDGAAAALRPDISTDGRYIVYHGSSSAADETKPDTIADIYVYDRVTGETRCVSRQPNGLPSGATNAYPSISGDAGWVAFLSDATNLTAGSAPDSMDLFVMVNPFALASEFDFGDAPLPYPTASASDGARHLAGGPTLGSVRDLEANGVPSAGADGDDNAGVPDDEDGVVFGSVQVGRLGATATVTVASAPAGARLDAWIDFNGDGSWGGADERIADGLLLLGGTNTIGFDVPSGAVPGETYARFRLSTEGVSAPAGAATDGEVEDYRVTIESPAAGSGFFVPRQTLSAVIRSPSAVITTDVDGDGDRDVLAASEQDDTITWYENDGNESFAAHTVSRTAVGVQSVFAADVDSDGDMDVLSASFGDNRIAWYENDGQEHFAAHMITDWAYGATSVFAADMDGDGDMDVLSTSSWDGKIAWYENDGNQEFASHTIATTATWAWSVFAIDVDGDGDMDALSASHGEIAWYENDGNRGFTAHTITTSIDGAHSVCAADVDSDGDVDVLSASAEHDKVAWYENDGNEEFTGRTITSSADGAMSVFAKDMDGDGDTDVLSASFYGNTVAWYENDGNESFAPHSIATSTEGARAVYADDVDDDGDVDMLSASTLASELAWYENDGEQNFLVRDLSLGGSPDGSDVAADVDGDGDIDVLAASVEGNMIWFENVAGEYSIPHIVTTSASGANSLFVADMDGDGDADLISASAVDDRVLWHENDGDGNFTEHTIAGVAKDAVSVVAADIDGDGDTDVVAAFAVGDCGLAWYENDGSGGFDAHLIDGPAIGVNCVVSADLDRDGDMDLLSTGAGNCWFAWHENDGEGHFTSHAIATPARTVYSLATADMDGDGDLDVLSTSWNEGQILWYEIDGNETFTSHTVAKSDTAIADSVFAADMDGDGDMDVLSATARRVNDSVIAWYENDGSGSFIPHTIEINDPFGWRVLAGDVDGDGDLDVLGPYEDRLVWYEQLNTQPVEVQWMRYQELPDLNLSEGEKVCSFIASKDGFLTVDASFNPSEGDVILRLFDAAGNLLHEQIGIDGYARMDLTSKVGTGYILRVSGNHPSVDVRICNLVANVQGIVTVRDTASADEFRYEYYEPTHYGPQHLVTINSIPYTFDLAEIQEVRFYGGGSVDRAVLAGSPGDEAVWFSAEASLINYSATGFYLTVSGAAEIRVDGGGGNDTLELVDSSGDDQLKITPSQVTMTGLPVAGRLYSFTANGFGDVQAYARAGGNDTVVLGTSEPGRVKVYPDSVKLMGADFYGRVKFFESTTVEMLSAKDSGVVSASTGLDALWAMKGLARIAYDIGPLSTAAPAFDDLAYDVTILGCERLAAQASGGDDWVELHDSARNDILIAKPHKTEMMNGPRAAEGIERGDEYEISARGFRNVIAIADQGGTGDAAKLYDSGELGVDVWAAAYVDGKTWSTMSSPSRRLYEVWGFEQVGGYGLNGGLGANHGTNRKDHAAGTDFVFQYGYWEGGDPPTDPRDPRG